MAAERDQLDDDDEEDSRHALLTALIKTGLVLSILGLAGGYLGWLHPLGDVLAIVRGPASVVVLVLALCAVWAGMRKAAFWSILLALLTGMSVVLAYVWPGPPGTFALYQKNLRFDNAELAALEADIRAAAPLALTLQELSEPNRALLQALADVYPHQHICPFTGVGATAVATSLPPVPGATACAPGLAAMQVTVTEGQRQVPVWIVSVHLHWPWPFGQSAHVAELRPVLEALEGPVLMGGDFNMVRWAVSVRRMALSARGIPAGPTATTFRGLGPLAPLPIDHVFAPGGGRAEYRPAFGSDHLGVLALLVL
jgi:endonuclease/exonuclease/phosphatase (EEP) superfamily protein YafD